MKIALLVSSYERSSSEFRELDPYPDPSAWVTGHRWERFLIDRATAVQQVRELAVRDFEAFVCLCDGAVDEDRAGIDVVSELERLGAAYTGAGPQCYEPTRLAMKLACADAMVDTPQFVFAENEADSAMAGDSLRFPVLVKHPNSYSSVDLSAADLVETPDRLWPRVARKVDGFGAALIEEFVEGREFGVLLAEPAEGEADPKAWCPVEVVFPPDETFMHFDLKWKDYKRLRTVLVTDDALAEPILHAAQRVFLGLGCSGYARIDLRMDREGRVFVIDVNPNPGVFYPRDELGTADYILSQSPGGHGAFLQHILACAFRRRERLLQASTPASRADS